MANRIIIENRSALSDHSALLLVADIVSQGRTTESDGQAFPKHRTYVKTYGFDGTRNKRSDKFLVVDL